MSAPRSGELRQQPLQLFAGNARFELSRVLGEGAMGVVYEAFDHDHRYSAAVTAPSTGFELRGRDGDETRLLVGDVGYSLAVPGHPRVIAPPAEAPRYSVFGWGSLRSILLDHQSWIPGTLPSLDARVAMYAGDAVADVLCRDLDGIESLHDYRGWAWGCYSAADNRPGAGELSWRALSPAMGN